MSKENDVETLRHIRARRVAYRESITLPELKRSWALDALAVAASAATMEISSVFTSPTSLSCRRYPKKT
jgi:hypothetical protein